MANQRVGEVAALFLRLGVLAFGGPAAHIAMMRDEVVRRRAWVSDQEFLDMMGAVNLIPGPNSTELAIHLSARRAGWMGLIVGGALFILPAALIVGILAWAYVEFGTTVAGEGLLYGVKPVVIAIVVIALAGLLRVAIKGIPTLIVGASAVALYLLGVNELALLFGGGALLIAYRMGRRAVGGTAAAALPVGVWFSGLLPALSMPVPGFNMMTLFLTFLKIGAVLYGSGYVLLAFLRGDFVERLGWLTEQQLLVAVSVGQVTPGPVFTTATFVGYIAGGPWAAAIATVGIFLPSFLLVALLSKIVPLARRSELTATLLDGVNATALGLMAAVTWQLGRAAIFDIPTILIAAAALAVLKFTRLNSAWLIGVAAGIGVIVELVR